MSELAHIFEVVGLWQEYYLYSHGKQPKGNEKVATRVERIGQWAGVSRAQLFRDLTPGRTALLVHEQDRDGS